MTTENMTEMLNAALQRAVDSELDVLAKSMAKEALTEMLTDEARAEMAEAARHQVEIALNPPAATEDDEAGEDAAAEPAPPKTHYANVVDFVENYVAVTYRRDATAHNGKLRWCPQWWRHGEVKSRFAALWMAFEKLRLGKGLEQSQFWLQHFDPMMARIFDGEGPFKHCSTRDGHQPLYGVLPTVPADSRVADARTIPGVSDDGWTEMPGSKILVPNNFDPDRKPREVVPFI
ncbi:DUF4913 domain-containing protein [Nocardia sp. NPDC059195]|uniref:DUF4913 domain-containing protein n=1 Tax=Nocardia sp. NPDC059195 TaxID=3346765 RepID=UPI0036B37F78